MCRLALATYMLRRGYYKLSCRVAMWLWAVGAQMVGSRR